MKKIFIYIVAIVVILIIVFLSIHKKAIYNQNQSDIGVLPEMTGGASGQFARIQSNAIFLADQNSFDEVYINVLNINDPGFVIISRDDTKNPESIIGVSKWLKAGDSSGLTVSTAQQMSEDSTYYVSIVKDDGDGVFEPKDDDFVMSDNDKTKSVTASFKIDSKAKDPREVQFNF
jgi:hypothetical protein